MSNVVIRALEPRDDEGFRRVRSVVYRNGETVPKEDQLLRSDCLAYVGEINGEVVASTTVIDMTATKGAGTLRCGGLAAVGVIPERRRSGIGGMLMSEVLPLLRHSKFSIVSLYPFRSTYYRKFGYEHCGSRIEVNCPSDRMPKIRTELDPTEISSESRDKIFPCYEQFARRYAGMNLRKSPEHWWRAHGGDKPFQIYAFGDPFEGYVVLRLNSDFWSEQNVKEIVWNTPRAYEAILAFLKSLSMNKTAVVWTEPGDSPFRARFQDQGVRFTFSSPIMYRLIDIRSALNEMQSEDSGEFSFQVEDTNVVENRGPWQVCFGPDGTKVEKGGNPSFELSIGALTQAFLGEPSFEQLLNAGSIRVVRPKEIHPALRFFKPQSAFCTDFF